MGFALRALQGQRSPQELPLAYLHSLNQQFELLHDDLRAREFNLEFTGFKTLDEVQDCSGAIQSAISESANIGGPNTNQGLADRHMQSAEIKIVQT